MAEVRPSHQLSYLKRALPEEARRVLLQSHIRTVGEAWQVLEELYDPPKDTSRLLADIEAITQKPGEKMMLLAGRIEAAVGRYSDEVAVTRADQAKLVQGRFIRAVRDVETRNMLTWGRDNMTLREMIRKGQEMADLKEADARPRSARRVQEPESQAPRGDEPGVLKAARQVNQADEVQNKLLQQMADIQRQLTTLQARFSEGRRSKGQERSRNRFLCWNCNEQGHKRDDCPNPLIGNGFTYRPEFSRSRRGGSQKTTPSHPAPGAGEA